MATRCNIVLTFGSSKVYLYRHNDGYPGETGADLVMTLRPQVGQRLGADAFLKALLAKPDYELTTELHGDVEYVYGLRFAYDNGKAEVACRHFPIGSERIEHLEYGELAALVEKVNEDRAFISARLQARGEAPLPLLPVEPVTVPGPITWYVGEVKRENAGGVLYAPVRFEGDKVIEHGMTPSHSHRQIQKAVDLLNAAEVK